MLIFNTNKEKSQANAWLFKLIYFLVEVKDILLCDFSGVAACANVCKCVLSEKLKSILGNIEAYHSHRGTRNR